jgi:ABC-2 type transport system permease protein
VRIAVYKNSLMFGLTQVTNYRSDIWLNIVNKLITLSGVIFLWSIIGKISSDVAETRLLISYFLIANGVQGLVDAESLRFSKAINREVKLGGLSAHLLRPVNTVMFVFANFLGTRGVSMLTTILLIVIGFLFLKSVTMLQIVLFLVCVALAFVVAFIFNMFIGSLSFWSPESHHFQNVMSHVLKVFSGVLIPISFFSGTAREVLIRSPFPSLGYLPATVIQSKTITSEMMTVLFSTTIWWCESFLL